jgi:hypothetical protein
LALNQNIPNAQAPLVNLKTGIITKAWFRFLATLLSSIYPVGSLYFSTTATNPATTLGFGTWVAFGAGQVPVGYSAGDPNFGTLGGTGGEKTHTLTIAEMPAHTHDLNRLLDAVGTGGNPRPALSGTAISGFIASAGGDGAHNNLQPYIVVSIWQRTA